MRNLDLLRYMSLEEFSKATFELVHSFETEEQFRYWLGVENTFIQEKEEEENS